MIRWLVGQADKILMEKETTFALEVQRKARDRNEDLADAIKLNSALVKQRRRVKREQDKINKQVADEVEDWVGGGSEETVFA